MPLILMMEIVFSLVLLIIDTFTQPQLVTSTTVGYLEQSNKVFYNSGPNNSTMAKKKFCSQDIFDSISSVNDQTIRFTVNRFVHSGEDYKRLYDDYKLIFNKQKNSFAYHHAVAEFKSGNVQPRGGFYIHQLGIYIDFYGKINPKTRKSEKNLFCCHQNSPVESNSFNCKDLQSTIKGCKVDTHCYYITKECWTWEQTRIFPEDIYDYLERIQLVAFVYESKLEKIMYSFWNRSNPFMLSAIRIISSPLKQIIWFTKKMDYEKRQYYIGAFNWKPEFNYEKIYFMVRSNSNNEQFKLAQLLDSKSVAISTQHKSWMDFFGCTQNSIGDFDLQISRKSVTYFPIYMIVILAIVILFSILMALNMTRKWFGSSSSSCICFKIRDYLLQSNSS